MCMYVCMYVYIRVYVCMCVCMCIYVYVYVSMCAFSDFLGASEYESGLTNDGNKSIDLGFRWGYFRADYSIVLISRTAISKYPFVFDNCGAFILSVFQTFSLQFYLRAPLWIFLYSFFFCALILQEHTSIISSAEGIFYY